MPGQKTKFSDSRLHSTDSNGDKVNEWCRKGKDEYNGYCFCVMWKYDVTMVEKHNVEALYTKETQRSEETY